MGSIFNDEKQSFAQNYYDMTGKTKVKGKKEEEEFNVSGKKVLKTAIIVSLLIVVISTVGVFANNKSKKDQHGAHYNTMMEQSQSYNDGYKDGIDGSFDEHNGTDNYYNDGYRDGVADAK